MINVMDKFTPAYDLEAFKRSQFEIKRSAMLGAASLGFKQNDIYQAVSLMERKHFYKSMTSYQDYRIWQDVYHVPYRDIMLYIKFTKGTLTDFTLLSFKEK